MNRLRCFLMILSATIATSYSQSIGWSLVNAKLRSEFPDVRRVTTSELADSLGNKNKPVLLDVRTKAEFAVSHLDGAIRVEPGSDATAISIPRNKAIVTYCSVGYRKKTWAGRLL